MAGALNIAATRFQRTQGMPALNRARRRQYADGGDVAADPGYVDNGDWDTNQATTSADQPSQGGVLSQRGAQTQSPDPASAQKIYALQSAQAILAAARSGSAPVPSQQPGAINLPLLASAGALMAPTPGGFGASLGNAFTAGATALQQQRDTDEKARLANVQADALNLQNLSAASTLPVTIARNQTMTRILSDPSFLQQLQGAPGSSPTPTPSSYASAVTGEEGAGKNPLSSATGPGQFIDGTWQSFAKENPQYFSGMSPTQIMAARSDPTLGALATDWLATKNAGALQAYGVPPSGQSLALAHYLGPKAAAAVMQAPPDMPASTAVANVLGKDKAAEYVQANPNLAAMTSGGLRNRYSNIPDPGQGSGDGAASSQQALNVAGQYEAQANRIELAKSLGLPIPGDPAALRAAAQQWRQLALAGPEALAKVPGALAEKGFRSTPGGGLEPIPGGEADPGYVSQKAAAQAGGEATAKPVTDRFGNMYILGKNGQFQYLGRGSEVKPVWDAAKGQMVYGDVGGVGIGAQPPKNGSAPAGGTSGQAEAPPPLQQHFMTERGKDLADQFNKIDADAASAKEGNYLFDNLRNDSQSWTMGKFANFEGDARAWLSAVGHTMGVDTSGLDKPLADYQAFLKSSGSLLRTAVHDVSSRAAVQEYNLIGQTLPQPTTSQQGFGQVADQWQGANDFRLAKQKFAARYQNNPQDFNVNFNGQVSPISFMLNRMSQTQQGQSDMQTMLGRMQTTPEGRLAARHMLGQYQFAKKNGLFDDLPATDEPTTSGGEK